MTAGNMYSLTGAASTTAFTNGAVANTSAFANTSAVVTDPAGNVVVGPRRRPPGHPGDRRVHRHLLRPGDDQGPRLPHRRRADSHQDDHPGHRPGFSFAGASVTPPAPYYGITWLADGAPGDLLVANGASATTAAAYQITGGPTSGGVPAPTIASITPPSGSIEGGTAVTITGTSLAGGAVTFGTSSADVVTTSDSSLDVLTPAHPLGPVDGLRQDAGRGGLGGHRVHVRGAAAHDHVDHTELPARPRGAPR